MLFNSIHFLIFFPIVTFLYFALPPRLRWGLLLAASCYFYMAFIPIYILILAFPIVIDYFAGLLIGYHGVDNSYLRMVVAMDRRDPRLAEWVDLPALQGRLETANGLLVNLSATGSS
jgi:hypothetical protein